METASKIYIAGHRGLVGSALVRNLQKEGYQNLIFRTSKELDLRRQAEVELFFAKERPEFVFLAAAKVGGILANNTYPAEFIYDNIAIEMNIIKAAHLYGVKKILFFGSSCIYPKNCPQPMKEEYLLTGPLEPTNEAYAIAKIAGIKLCQSFNKQYGTNFLSVMPTNLYGPGDNFDFQTSHVLPALIRKFHLAKLSLQKEWQKLHEDEARMGTIPEDLRVSIGLPRTSAPSDCSRIPKVIIWGTGKPYREFLHVDDLADACIFIMKGCDVSHVPSGIINIGYGKEITIRDLAELVRQAVGFDGKVTFDLSKPDGTPRKLLDITRLSDLGWEPKVSLRNGIRKTYEWYSSLASE